MLGGQAQAYRLIETIPARPADMITTAEARPGPLPVTQIKNAENLTTISNVEGVMEMSIIESLSESDPAPVAQLGQ